MSQFPDPRNMTMAEIDELLMALSHYRDLLMSLKQMKRDELRGIKLSHIVRPRIIFLMGKLGKYAWKEDTT